MPADAPQLLPRNATSLERALEQATARLGSVETPIATLWDVDTIAPDLLPWLGWSLSIDRWDSTWTVEQKRAAVGSAIAMQRIKGTPTTVKSVLASFDALLEYAEWWEQSPRGQPGTFEVRLPMDGAGGTRSTAAFAQAILTEVTRVKRESAHFVLFQTLASAGRVGVVGVARTYTWTRRDGIGAPDTSQPWDTFLQTEIGEPMQAETGDFLTEQA